MGTTEKKNLYLPGQNLSNLANNTDYNRVGDDKTVIEVDFTGSPAEVTIKTGSIFECNGNLYTVTADEVFTLSTVNDKYIIFDPATLTYAGSTTPGTFDPTQLGFYSGGLNNKRTLKWYIDQDAETFGVDQRIYENTDTDISYSDLDLYLRTSKILYNSVPVFGYMDDGTPLYAKQVLCSAVSTVQATGNHGITNALTNTRIVSATPRGEQAVGLLDAYGFPINSDGVNAGVAGVEYDDTQMRVLLNGSATIQYNVFVVYTA